MFHDGLNNFDVPPEVAVEDLQSNGKLLSELAIKKLENDLSDRPYGRYSKNDLKSDYGIIKGVDGLYAIYSDKRTKEQREIGRGTFGKIKYAQNLTTGEWFVLKTMRDRDEAQSWSDQIFSTFGLKPPPIRATSKSFYQNELAIQTTRGKCDPAQIIRKSKKNATVKYNILLKREKGKPLQDWIQYRLRQENESKSRQQTLPTWFNYFFIRIALKAVCTFQTLIQGGYLHRDLKLDNFLYDIIKDEIALIDFGFSARSNKGKATSQYRMGGLQAPEINYPPLFAFSIAYNEKSEMYSLGKTLKELLMQIKNKCIEDHGHRMYTEEEYSLGCRLREHKDLNQHLKFMTNRSPNLRPTIAMSVKFFEELEKTEAKNHPDEVKAFEQFKEEAQAAEQKRIDGIKKIILEKRKKHNAAQNKFHIDFTDGAIDLAIQRYEQRRNKLPCGLFWLAASKKTLHLLRELKKPKNTTTLSAYEKQQLIEYFIQKNPEKAFARELRKAKIDYQKAMETPEDQYWQQLQPVSFVYNNL